MMNNSRQLNLPPQEVQRLSTAVAPSGKSLSIDFCELVVSAFIRCGHNREQAAGLLHMAPTQFTKCFGPNYPKHNPVMKRLGQIPADVLKEFASLLAEKVGLSAGIDSAKVEASVRVADAVLNLMKVSSR